MGKLAPLRQVDTPLSFVVWLLHSSSTLKNKQKGQQLVKTLFIQLHFSLLRGELKKIKITSIESPFQTHHPKIFIILFTLMFDWWCSAF